VNTIVEIGKSLKGQTGQKEPGKFLSSPGPVANNKPKRAVKLRITTLIKDKIKFSSYIRKANAQNLFIHEEAVNPI
jgi:hypothetical protein